MIMLTLYILMWSNLKTLTIVIWVKEAHFNCLWSPTTASVFKVKVVNVFYGCNRNRTKEIDFPYTDTSKIQVSRH